MKKIMLKDLKHGEYFTRKPIECPNEHQVLIKDDYLRSEKKYICIHFDDVCNDILLKGTTEVYIDFYF